MLTIEQGADKIVSMCMGVSPGEKVIIVTDIMRPISLSQALYKSCKRKGADAISIIFDGNLVNGQVDSSIAKAIESADVLLCLTTSTIAYTKAVDVCRKNGCRVAAITDATEDTFKEGSIEADYLQMAVVIEEVRKLFDAADEVCVTSPGGTELRLSINNRRSHVCNGVLREPGGLIGLPAMEVYIAPIENSTNGILVADASGSGLGCIQEPISLIVSNGKVVEITGGEQANALSARLAETNEPNSFTVAEFAIGLNPCAKLVGHISVDEGIYGTGHFALGNNLGFGGNNDAPQHLDLVYWRPTIKLDGKPFMKEGRLVEFDSYILNSIKAV